MPEPEPAIGPLTRRPKLLEQVRRCARARHFARRTEEAYVRWIRRYVRYHNLRHPTDLGAQEVSIFLAYLANEQAVSPSTQLQAVSALTFLYEEVLGRPLDLPKGVRSPRRRRQGSSPSPCLAFQLVRTAPGAAAPSWDR